ncbi:SIS domain-containing protein [Micromonospora sp. GCM10011542]|uniref:D-sedoheptulose-7-phosphate isomerase n=1 Tax=Micromonospora sp. GCM10011542 TaxID=3317337 RepID=UPI00361C4AA4
MSDGFAIIDAHLSGLAAALLPYRREAERLVGWGTQLAWTLANGGRLLVAGNGGSAAEAQHLTAELVGKLHHDRQPLSAIALHAETSALTAIANDYGYPHVYARQVQAHGREGDILLLLTTSGTSTNLLTAAHTAHHTGLTTWALTGPTPNPLADTCHDTLAIDSPDPQVVQELHLVTSHLLCEYVEQALPLVQDLPRFPAPVTRTVGAPHRPGPGERPLATAGHGANGHGANGHGANGHGANGHGANGHALNLHVPAARDGDGSGS